MGGNKSKMSSPKNVYLEIAINNQNIGRIEIELNDAVSSIKKRGFTPRNLLFYKSWKRLQN